MKRFHVHVSVPDLAASIRFYSTLFGSEPDVVKDDYARWMLDGPRVHFAISQRENRAGVAHLGVQTDTDEELEALHSQLRQSDLATHAEKEVSCCYARSNKYWITDPAGVAWETFHTLGTIPTYDDDAAVGAGAACCGTDVATVRGKIGTQTRAAGTCCG
jgi:catechol 2,3-dioxygenase-like lactoylglutathione lyase family enzyme